MVKSIENDTIRISVDSLGAELHSITGADGLDYLWRGDPEYWAGRAPVLFPIVGALRNGRAVSAEGEITLPRHGFARTHEWELEAAGQADLPAQVQSQNKAAYPYDFILRVSYIIGDSSVTTAFTVQNAGEKAMPFCIGGHPAFNIPLVEGERFEDYVVRFEKPEAAGCPYVDLEKGIILSERRPILDNSDSIRLSHSLFKHDALVFDNLKSRSVRLYSEKSGRGVRMDFGGMDYFAIWSPIKASRLSALSRGQAPPPLKARATFLRKAGNAPAGPWRGGVNIITVKIF